MYMYIIHVAQGKQLHHIVGSHYTIVVKGMYVHNSSIKVSTIIFIILITIATKVRPAHGASVLYTYTMLYSGLLKIVLMFTHHEI